MSERWTTEEQYVFEGTVIDVGVFRDGEHMGECSASFAEWLIPRLNAAQALVDAAMEIRARHDADAKRCNFYDCGCDDCKTLSSALEPFREKTNSGSQSLSGGDCQPTNETPERKGS